MERRNFIWNLGKRALILGPRTLIMGVVNVTPDSFSDGGRYFDPERAIEHGLRLIEEGADILDIGGESTRPGAAVAPEAGESSVSEGATPVSAAEEMRRVLPVIGQIRRVKPATVISIDTYKAEVAKAALAAGAEIVNDVSAFRWDSRMASTVAEAGCGAVMMHMRGRPEEWRHLQRVSDIVGLVSTELANWAAGAIQNGVGRESIVLDPGFGFGKTFEANYPLLARFEELQQLGFPLLAGTSKKSFIGRVLSRDGQDAPLNDRIFGTIASETLAIAKGAHIIRTHEVKASVDAARLADAILSAD
jgi:dihydropteroate synthase